MILTVYFQALFHRINYFDHNYRKKWHFVGSPVVTVVEGDATSDSVKTTKIIPEIGSIHKGQNYVVNAHTTFKK